MSNLPAQSLQPEAMEVVEQYLRFNRDINLVATELNTTPTVVGEILNKKEVRGYLDHLFMEAGFRNREKFFDVLDNILEDKL